MTSHFTRVVTSHFEGIQRVLSDSPGRGHWKHALLSPTQQPSQDGFAQPSSQATLLVRAESISKCRLLKVPQEDNLKQANAQSGKQFPFKI